MGFSYAAPKSVDDALAILAARGGETTILAGGMVVVAAMKQNKLAATHIMNIKGIGLPPEPVIDATGDTLTIGALVSHRRVETDETVGHRLPALRALEQNLAAVQIRNCGTLAGNLCAAEPASDLPCLMAALGARLVLRSARRRREIAVEDWIVAPGTTRRETDELALAIELAMPKPMEGVGYRRLVQRQGLAPPLACAAARISWDQHGQTVAARIFVGAVGPTPQRLKSVEALLQGTAIADLPSAAIAEAARREVECLSDDRCSAEYRREVVGVLVRRAIGDALAG
jgi:carbon-monoxide dehydrogenase medium subunit